MVLFIKGLKPLVGGCPRVPDRTGNPPGAGNEFGYAPATGLIKGTGGDIVGMVLFIKG